MEIVYGFVVFVVSVLVWGICEYLLFQVVLLVMDCLCQEYFGLGDEVFYDQLEFQVNFSFGFLGSDVDWVEFFEECGMLWVWLCFNLIGLFGVSLLLLVFYSEQVLGDSEEGNFMWNFFDFFYYCLYWLLLLIWCKYCYWVSFQSGVSDVFFVQLFVFVGLGGEEICKVRELNWKCLLFYLGLFSLWVYLVVLIELVLCYYFKYVELVVEQCIEWCVVIFEEQCNWFGLFNSQFGEDVVLGEWVCDCSGKFCIYICQFDWQCFYEFLLIGFGYQLFCVLVCFILCDLFDYDIWLVLCYEEICEFCIGVQNVCCFGWISWLGWECVDGVVMLGSKIY